MFLGSQILVAAAENETKVSIILKVQQNTWCGQVFIRKNDQASLRFNLQSQEVVSIICDNDVTGSYVVGSKPVAVWSGNICSSVSSLFDICFILSRDIALNSFFEKKRKRVEKKKPYFDVGLKSWQRVKARTEAFDGKLQF